MSIDSISSSANRLITSSQQKSVAAAQDLANLSIQKDEVGGSRNVSKTDPLQPILASKGAQQDAQMAVKLFEEEKKKQGRFLDVVA